MNKLYTIIGIIKEESRQGQIRGNKVYMVCGGDCFSISLHNIGDGLDISKLKNGGSLFCRYNRLSPYLNKIGCGSAMPNSEKNSFSNLLLHSTFAIFEEDRMRLGNA